MPKSALITGASQRIGAYLCEQLHAQGYHVIIHSRTLTEAVQQQCDHYNSLRAGSASLFILNFSNKFNDIETKACLDQAPPLQLLINNAAVFYPTPLDTLDQGAWDDIMQSNLQSVLWLSRQLAPRLRDHHGQIINISDSLVHRPHPDYIPYYLSKAGVNHLTASLAQAWAPMIRVNAVALGPILPPEGKQTLGADAQQRLRQNPLQRQAALDEVFQAVDYLCHRAPHTTGQILHVDGGCHLNHKID